MKTPTSIIEENRTVTFFGKPYSLGFIYMSQGSTFRLLLRKIVNSTNSDQNDDEAIQTEVIFDDWVMSTFFNEYNKDRSQMMKALAEKNFVLTDEEKAKMPSEYNMNTRIAWLKDSIEIKVVRINLEKVGRGFELACEFLRAAFEESGHEPREVEYCRIFLFDKTSRLETRKVHDFRGSRKEN